MTAYVSMLRGVNVGGSKKIKMSDLAALYESLGFKDAKTYIQSGNVVFSSPEPSQSVLSKKIEKALKESFGFDVAVVVRTGAELEKALENDPFKDRDPGKLHITFLSDSPAEKPFDVIDSAKDSSEEYLISGREAYLFLPNGYGRTKLSNNFFEKKLNLSATTRNWRTVKVLAGMAMEIS